MAISKVMGRVSRVSSLFVIIFYAAELNLGTAFPKPVRLEQRDPNSLNETMLLPPPVVFFPLTTLAEKQKATQTTTTTTLAPILNDTVTSKPTTLTTAPFSLDTFQGTTSKFGLEFRLDGPFGNITDPTTEDATRPTTTEITPMSFPIRGTGRLYGRRCETYGSFIFGRQTSGVAVSGNQKALMFSERMCRLNHRLECVPTRGKEITTTDPTIIDTTPSPGPGGPVRKGFCRCHRGLSERAIFLRAADRKEEFGEFASGCYIPAGFAHSSLCGHEVALPYGLINNGTLLRRTVGNTATMCVPNAECRIGYKYTGLRCVCVKTAIWSPKEGTCMIVLGGHQMTPLPVSALILLVFVLHFHI